MEKNKNLKVINQTKRKRLDKILASTLAGILCAGALAGGGYYAYKQIKDRDKTIDDQKTTIGQLEEENNVSKGKIEELTNNLSAKVSELAEKDKQIADKDNLIEENNQKIQKLNGQKTTLLASVAEIDNKLTATTDAVDVDNLEARKTAILGQIDTLNAEIANLTNEKTQLQSEIATLTAEKTQLQNQIADLQSALEQLEKSTGFTFVTKTKILKSYLGDILVPESVLNINDIVSGKSSFMVANSAFDRYSVLDGSGIKNLLDNYSSHYSDTVFAIADVSYYSYSFNDGHYCHIEEPHSLSSDTAFDDVAFYYNGVRITEFNCKSKVYDQYFYFAQISNNKLSIYIMDAFAYGKYVSNSGDYIDFNSEKLLIDGQIASITSSYFSHYSSSIEFKSFVYTDLFGFFGIDYDADNDCFTYNGETFTKVSSEETEATVSESNLKMALFGSVDDKQTILCFNDANYASNLMQKQTSDGDFVCVGKLGFVSWDDSTKTLTLKNNDNNENIVLTNVIITKQPDGSFDVSSGTWNGNFFGC